MGLLLAGAESLANDVGSLDPDDVPAYIRAALVDVR
jgi:hypothetical protein